MKFRIGLLSLSLLPLGGCAYLDAQANLVEQARKGVAMVAAAQADHAALIEQFSASRHREIDAGFDEDVRQQTNLSAEWVIEHRKAYAAGLAALFAWHAGTLEAQRATLANLKAVDAALERVEALQKIGMQWLNPK